MKITNIEIRLCRHDSAPKGATLNTTTSSALEYLVISIHTDEGHSGHSFGFAGKGAEMAGQIAATCIKPWLLGKDPWFREAIWQEFLIQDRWWNHSPIYTYGPFDVALWDLAGRACNQPIYRMLGAYRERVPVYASSMRLAGPEDYAREALEVRKAGLIGYKLHPPGTYAADLACYRACREAVGDDFILMADPVGSHHYDEALRMGRELERLGFYWFEEPLPDTDLYSLKKLTEKLDIPIVGTEVIAGAHRAIAQCIEQKVVDRVRTDVSWKGGISQVMKAARLAESFGMQCELHTTIYHPLELANLHCACAMANCEFFEILWPKDTFNFGLSKDIEIGADGYAHAPESPGLGIEFDWDLIDRHVFRIL
jgi:L-alanine-DL-glutamate epimerase-like enolase superfamily enzyme